MKKISMKNSAEAIHSSLEGKSVAELDSALKNAVKFLDKKRMLGKSEDILIELEKIIDKKNGILKIKVKSAKKIPDDKRKELESQMIEKYKAKGIESIYLEDKHLLGGMRIEIGEEVMDMTYRNKLNQLSKFLLK